ncbi:hypothetical protein F3Y22_tig00009796pilonHSYRG00037 [Hibiscus syriacus]|uniref:Uncharacterized protein n=1 Tax=Hibiscus syriacus TaxID=106335 RepID=A0A6A3C7T8_HIBSY|nr:hypothetical protein F3Y22_tig00009796pilonHSYRG00037 [Hibiscus syriacus]
MRIIRKHVAIENDEVDINIDKEEQILTGLLSTARMIPPSTRFPAKPLVFDLNLGYLEDNIKFISNQVGSDFDILLEQPESTILSTVEDGMANPTPANVPEMQIPKSECIMLTGPGDSRIQKDLVDTEKLQTNLADETLTEACDLKRALETVTLLETQLKEMNPNLDSISDLMCLVVTMHTDASFYIPLLKNVSIVGNYVKDRTKDAQFIIVSLRNNMFELADRLVGIYKTENCTKSITIDPNSFVVRQKAA